MVLGIETNCYMVLGIELVFQITKIPYCLDKRALVSLSIETKYGIVISS